MQCMKQFDYEYNQELTMVKGSDVPIVTICYIISSVNTKVPNK